MALTKESQRAWLNQHQEEVIDPDREIIDPHHHLWRNSGLPEYLLPDLWEDTESGHNITKTVFMECGAEYRQTGPEHLKVVGETEFVHQAAIESRVQGKAEIAGIVAHANLDQDEALLREVFDAHNIAGDGLFKGIRHLILTCLPKQGSGGVWGYWVNLVTATILGITTFRTTDSPNLLKPVRTPLSCWIILEPLAGLVTLRISTIRFLQSGKQALAAWRNATMWW